MTGLDDARMMEDGLELQQVKIDRGFGPYTDVDGDSNYQKDDRYEDNPKADPNESSGNASFLLPEESKLLSSNFTLKQSYYKFKVRFRVIIGIILGITIYLVALRKPEPSILDLFPPNSNWNGWNTMEYAFVFGDSWTETHFNYSGQQPSLEEPLGNQGRNSANATNWVGFLTNKYNASRLRTYNFASGGASLDNRILPAYPTPIERQIYEQFMGNYGTAFYPPWTGSNSIFFVWAGIVDLVLMNAHHDPEIMAAINSKLTATYSKLIDSLYGAGARNIVLMHVPPVNRTHLPPNSEVVQQKFTTDVVDYIDRVQTVGEGMKRYPDANIWVFDTFSLFTRILDNPQAFPQTSGIPNPNDVCFGYFAGAPTIDYFLPDCGRPVNQYMWLDTLHPTYPAHDVIAEHLAKALWEGPNI